MRLQTLFTSFGMEGVCLVIQADEKGIRDIKSSGLRGRVLQIGFHAQIAFIVKEEALSRSC